MHSRKPALSFIFLTLLLDVLGFGLIIPVAPRLIEQLQGGGEADAAPIVGWLTATYAAMQFVFAPLLGALSDRFGRRPVLLTSLFGSGLDYFAMALVPTVPWLFVARAVNGLTGASITAANAYIADITPPDKRAAGFGLVGAAFGLGFVLGPLLGGLLGSIDIHYPFYAAGAVTLLNWLYGLIILPESLPRERRRSIVDWRWNPLQALSVLRRNAVVTWLAAGVFLLNLAQFGLHATWVLYTKYRYGWDERAVGYSLFAVGLGAAIVQGGLARRIIPRIGEVRAVRLGFVLAVFAYLGYGLASEGWMIYLAIAVASLGGLAMPACQSLITQSVRPDEQGLVQGGLSGAQGLANIVGPVLGSQIFAFSIASERSAPWPGAVFFSCAALALLALPVVGRGLLAARP